MDCNARIRSDAIGRIAIDPFHGFGRVVVSAYYFPEPLAAFRVTSGSWSVAIGNGQSVDFCQFVLRISLNPAYTVSRFDIAACHLMAKINKYLRLLFYRFLVKQIVFERTS